VAEGGALLRRYTGLNRYRGFESLSLRQTVRANWAVLRCPENEPTSLDDFVRLKGERGRDGELEGSSRPHVQHELQLVQLDHR
jgi:hypothetical protein